MVPAPGTVAGGGKSKDLFLTEKKMPELKTKGHAAASPIVRSNNIFVPIDGSLMYKEYFDKNISTIKRAANLAQDWSHRDFNVYIYDIPLASEGMVEWLHVLSQKHFKGAFAYIDHHYIEGISAYETLRDTPWAYFEDRSIWPSTLYGVLSLKEEIRRNIRRDLPTIHFIGRDFDAINSACAVAFDFHEPEKDFFRSVDFADTNNRFDITPLQHGELVTSDHLSSKLSPVATTVDQALKGSGSSFADQQETLAAAIDIYTEPNNSEVQTILAYRKHKYVNKKMKDTIDIFNNHIYSVYQTHLDTEEAIIIPYELTQSIDVALLNTLVSFYASRAVVVTYREFSDWENNRVIKKYKLLYHNTEFKGLSKFLTKSLQQIGGTNVINLYGPEGRFTIETTTNFLTVLKDMLQGFFYEREAVTI